jgi:hypothetical protein
VKIVRADDGSFLHGRGRSIIGLLVEGSALPVTVAGTVCTGLDKIRKKIEELSGRNRCKGSLQARATAAERGPGQLMNQTFNWTYSFVDCGSIKTQ